MVAAVFVRELEDGQAVDQVLLVREAEVRSTRNGSDFLRLVLADSSGSVPAVLWDCPGDTARVAAVGVALRVAGDYGVHPRYGPQLRLRSLRAARPDEYLLEDLLDGPARDPDQMEGDLRALVATVQDGHLRGQIALGYYRVRREIEAIGDFPAPLAEAILHIILSHHGTLEHGSPVMPCTREATLVHMVDNLGGKLGSFDRLEKELVDGQRWSGFDKALSAPAYFAAARQAA